MALPDQAQPTQFYSYQKLDATSSIRLLHIEGPPNDAFASSCQYSVIQTTLNQAPVYETLSYVWGTTDRSELLVLKDGNSLRITKPLVEALAFVEKQCSTGYLWVDQICIDQDDLNERGHQVKLMGQIYSSCSRVLVWLGQLSRLDSEVSLADEPGQGQIPKGTSVPKGSTTRHILSRLRKLVEPGESSTGSIWHELLQSQWFQRAWVFQEIVLPPAALFVLGTRSHQALTMTLSDLHEKVNPQDPQAIKITGADTVISTICIMYRRWSEHRGENHRQHSPIEQTLSLLSPRAKTSDELDRLYAFFGLNADTRIDLNPSYLSSLGAAMMDTAISIIEGTCSLDLFEVIPRAVDSKIYRDIPTWTPDFREEHLVTPFKRSNTDFRQLAQSFPQLCPVFLPTQTLNYGAEKRTIQAYGLALDHISYEIGSLSSRSSLETQIDALLQRSIKAWHKIKSSSVKASLASSSRQEGNTIDADIAIERGFALCPTKDRLIQALTAEGHCDLTYNPTSSTQDTLAMERTILQVMQGRTLWMTSTGRFALGSHMHYRDHIRLVFGCSNPVALTYAGRDETKKVLGTCFLEGWMDPWERVDVVGMESKFVQGVIYVI